MSTIYEPKGKAREYSPLALNIYKGCDHNCFYCYVPNMLSRFNSKYEHENVSERIGVIEALKKDAKKLFNTDKQVLLSFTGDPYCKFNDKSKLTRQSLEVLLNNQIPTSILTKGGLRTLQDLDMFRKYPKESFKIGTTLVFDNDKHSLEHESGAAPFTERIEMLKILSRNNIQTWVSIEPVLNHKQSLECIKASLPYVDSYKVGKINHYAEIEKKIDWSKFLVDVVNIMRENKKEFYIKEDLRKWNTGVFLEQSEMDMDFLNLKQFPSNELF